jgi:acyl-CoA thioesterase FadM
MNLYFRLLKVIILSFFRERLKISGTSKLSFRVMPHDIDLNLHLNNGRYCTIMDLGRIDFTIRCGLIRQCVKKRWLPVLSSTMMRYIRPINIFQRFDLYTDIICWDDKYVYMKQQFIQKDKLMAVGIVRGLFMEKDKKVPIQEMVNAIQLEVKSPPVPEWISKWMEGEKAIVIEAFENNN